MALCNVEVHERDFDDDRGFTLVVSDPNAATTPALTDDLRSYYGKAIPTTDTAGVLQHFLTRDLKGIFTELLVVSTKHTFLFKMADFEGPILFDTMTPWVAAGMCFLSVATLSTVDVTSSVRFVTPCSSWPMPLPQARRPASASSVASA